MSRPADSSPRPRQLFFKGMHIGRALDGAAQHLIVFKQELPKDGAGEENPNE